MIKSKDTPPSSKPVSFRLKTEAFEALDELVKLKLCCAGCGKKIKRYSSKTKIIEASLGGLAHFLLRGRISEQQIESNRSDPYRILRLFITYCRAERGESGYGFKGRSKKTRRVYGPERIESIYDHMVEKTKKKK